MIDREIKMKQKMVKFSWELLADYYNHFEGNEEDWEEEKALDEQKSRLKVSSFILLLLYIYIYTHKRIESGYCYATHVKRRIYLLCGM